MLNKVGFVLFVSLGVALLLVHTYAWLTPNDIFYSTIPFFDKVEHFWSGIVLAGLLASMKQTSPLFIFVIVLILGVIWEIGETELGYDAKTDMVPDILVNQIGALTCLLLWRR